MKRYAKAAVWAAVLLFSGLAVSCSDTVTDNCVGARVCQGNSLMLKLRCDGQAISDVEKDPGALSLLQDCGDTAVCEGREAGKASVLAAENEATGDGETETADAADGDDTDATDTADADTTPAVDGDADTTDTPTPPPAAKVYACYPKTVPADGDAE